MMFLNFKNKMNEELINEAKEKIKKAKLKVFLKLPSFGYFSAIVCDEIYDDGGPIETDGETIYYDLKKVLSRNTDDLACTILHEYLHIFLLHLERSSQYSNDDNTQGKFNVACDFAVAPIVRDVFGYVPEYQLYDRRFEHTNAEQIFKALPPGDYSNKKNNHSRWRNYKRNKQRTQKIKQAAQMARLAGNLPESLERAIDDLLRIKIDIRQVLQNIVTQSLTKHSDWTRRNKRYRKMYLPSSVYDKEIKFGVAIDTSGSINKQELTFYISILYDIIVSYNATITAVAADAKVQSIVEINTAKDVKKFIDNLKGGGGTDFRPAIKELEDRAVKTVLYFTDLEGTFPEQSSAEIYWITKSKKTVPIGHKIMIENEN